MKKTALISTLMFALPAGLDLDIYIWSSIILGCLFAATIGLKNLVFIQKEQIYYIISSALVFLFGIFFFLEFFGSEKYYISSIVLFLGVFLVLRDLYMFKYNGGAVHEANANMILANRSGANLGASILALITVELSWALSILPLDSLLRSIILISTIVVASKLKIVSWQ